jgi:hypothetical protein
MAWDETWVAASFAYHSLKLVRGVCGGSAIFGCGLLIA